MIGFLRYTEAARAGEEAIVQPGATHTYGQVLARIDAWLERLAAHDVGPGSVVTVEGDYGMETIAAFLALTEARCIIVPLSRDSAAHAEEFIPLAEVEWRLAPDRDPALERTGRRAGHALHGLLRERGAPGLVLFSSGSTGKNKAAVHDLSLLLRKFQVKRQSLRTLVFLQLDHIGGVNTLFYTLSNGGAVVVPANRSPATVAATIAAHRVELLPTSPTFLNLLLLSGEHERHDLSALRLITYGTETMPESTLTKVAAAFPQVKLQQTYGLTEVGILRSQSRDNGSLWLRVGGEGYRTKIVGNRLFVKAESAMLGYLNAANPFDAEGYFDTGDRVEVEGEWLRILGRESEIINVGGSKVYPAEVESVLLLMDNVEDVVAQGEKTPIMGQMVVAHVKLRREEPLAEFKTRMRQFCASRLAAYKIPSKVFLSADALYSPRFKRLRANIKRPETKVESDR